MTDAGKRFDTLVMAATFWFAVGLFSDGWAHVNRLPDSFWTVWHAILYSGYAATAAVILGAVAIRRPAAASWSAAIPRGYAASVIGIAVFAAGGLADVAWHIAFGVEVGNDALLSPSHLLLAVGGALMGTGPLRADLQRGDRSRSLGGRFPMVLSLGNFVSLLTFFTLYADPYAPLLGARFSDLREDTMFHGLLTMFLFSALISGMLLVMLRRTVLPVGTLTLVLGLNAVAMNFMHSRGPLEIQLTLIGVALFTGVIADLLIAVLRPSAARPLALRLVAALIPAVFWTLYFPAVAIHRGPLAWSFTFISGGIVVCAVIGLLQSYVAIPPVARSEPAS
ncbi:MAG: hypothetical protein ABI888_04210 [Chloroflexota bacterium]